MAGVARRFICANAEYCAVQTWGGWLAFVGRAMGDCAPSALVSIIGDFCRHTSDELRSARNRLYADIQRDFGLETIEPPCLSTSPSEEYLLQLRAVADMLHDARAAEMVQALDARMRDRGRGLLGWRGVDDDTDPTAPTWRPPFEREFRRRRLALLVCRPPVRVLEDPSTPSRFATVSGSWTIDLSSCWWCTPSVDRKWWRPCETSSASFPRRQAIWTNGCGVASRPTIYEYGCGPTRA